MKNIRNIFLILLFLLLNSSSAQTCGFGCLGLSGIFGGYSGQQYEATGLNDYLNSTIIPIYFAHAADFPQFNFKEGRGFKVGMNIIRAKYTQTFFTFKGYYQFLEESQSYSETSGNFETKSDAILKMDNWGIGLDFGITLFSFLDWKIIDGEVKFFNPKLDIKVTTNNPNKNQPYEGTFTPDDIKIGYSIGTGVIINLIQDYISIEATGMYTFIDINYLTNDIDGFPIPTDKSKSLISKGGYGGVVQLNVGIPF